MDMTEEAPKQSYIPLASLWVLEGHAIGNKHTITLVGKSQADCIDMASAYSLSEFHIYPPTGKNKNNGETK